MVDEDKKTQKRERESAFSLETSSSKRIPLPSDLVKPAPIKSTTPQRVAHSLPTSSSDLEISDSVLSCQILLDSLSPSQSSSHNTPSTSSSTDQSSTAQSDLARLSTTQSSDSQIKSHNIKPSNIKPSNIKPRHIASNISSPMLRLNQGIYSKGSDYASRSKHSLRVTIAEYCADLEIQLDLNIFQSNKSRADSSSEKEGSQKEYETTSPKLLNPSPIRMPKRSSRSAFPQTFTSLQTQHLPITREYSAGGLIFNSKDEVALIARRSRSGNLEWCLPKGHIESGETSEAAARREVYEETGILGDIVGSIATLDYWFMGDTEKVHKLVHHFILRQTAGFLSTEGDPDHEAEEARWVPFDQLTTTLNYPSERKIVWLYSRKYRNRHF